MTITEFSRRNGDWRETRGICALLGRWERASESVANWRYRKATLSATAAQGSSAATVAAGGQEYRNLPQIEPWEQLRLAVESREAP